MNNKKPQYPVFDLVLASIVIVFGILTVFFFVQWQEEKRENKGLRDFYEPHWEQVTEEEVTVIPTETHTYIVEGFVKNHDASEGIDLFLKDKNEHKDGILVDGVTASEFDVDFEKGIMVKVTTEKGNMGNVLNIEEIK